MQGVQVKLCYSLTMRAIPERLIRDAFCGSAIQIDYLYLHMITTHLPWMSAGPGFKPRSGLLSIVGMLWDFTSRSDTEVSPMYSLN